jgi:hypothetical protein
LYKVFRPWWKINNLKIKINNLIKNNLKNKKTIFKK